MKRCTRHAHIQPAKADALWRHSGCKPSDPEVNTSHSYYATLRHDTQHGCKGCLYHFQSKKCRVFPISSHMLHLYLIKKGKCVNICHARFTIFQARLTQYLQSSTRGNSCNNKSQYCQWHFILHFD